MLEAVHITKRFPHQGGSAQAIADISLTLGAGDFASVVGPSGCGKTTLLRCLAGLVPVSSGEVRFGGGPVHATPTGLALVFQDYGRSLFPWMTVWGNVVLPLRRLRLNRAERNERAREALAEVSLANVEDRYPWQLSGGMQQRVALARAIACRPRVLLMDEPFASVDAQTRSELQDMIRRIQARHEMSVLFVTHDIDEAIYVSDRIHVLSKAPATIARVIDIEIPPQRDQVETKALPQFAELRATLWALLAEPVANDESPAGSS